MQLVADVAVAGRIPIQGWTALSEPCRWPAAVADSACARSLVDIAFGVLSVHVSGPDGRCQGCVELSARLAPVPCPQLQRALLTVEAAGAITFDEPEATR